MTTRPDCYTCQHRHGVPGDAHSECRHPGATVTRGIALMTSAFAAPPAAKETVIECDASPGGSAITIGFQMHGIVNGWATWPMNYDPTWLTQCSGWGPKASPEPAQ